MPSGVYPRTPPLERALARFTIDESGCWLWSGSRGDGGYAKLSVNNKNVFVHRFIYQNLVGPIPEGLELDHVRARGCTHRHCINPDHLEPVTSSQNTQRGKSMIRHELCVNGHPFDDDNTYVSPRGFRVCRACLKARSSNVYQAKRPAKTRCKYGHPMVDPNVYLTPRGFRQCRTCLRTRALARYHREKRTAS